MELFTINEKLEVGLPIRILSEEIFTQDPYFMFRIIFVKSGTGIVKINGKRNVFMAPVVLCLNEKDEIELERRNDLTATTLYFAPRMVNRGLDLNNIRDQKEETIKSCVEDYFYVEPFVERSGEFIGIFDLCYTSGERMSQLLGLLNHEINNFENMYWACRSRSFLLEILFFIQHILTDHRNNKSVGFINSTAEMNDVLLYLHSNYSKKISITELEGIFHINRTTLSEKFRHATGTSIKNYLIKLRMKVAEMMLKDTLLPISEIAYRVGFEDGTHFSRMFKKYSGCLPSEYR